MDRYNTNTLINERLIQKLLISPYIIKLPIKIPIYLLTDENTNRIRSTYIFLHFIKRNKFFS